MKANTNPFFSGENEFNNLVKTYIFENRHRIRSKKSQKEDRLPILAFKRWLFKNNIKLLNENAIKKWMFERIKQVSFMTVAKHSIILNNFCRYLFNNNLISNNPFQNLRDQYRKMGFRGIARSLKETNDLDILNCLADIPFSGVLHKPFLDYFNYLKALGYKHESQYYTFEAFERYLNSSKL